MAIQVNFGTLKDKHPSWWTLKVDGPIADAIAKNGWDTCATQLSDALNKAGAVIDNYAFEDATLAGGRVRALPDKAGRNYIYSVIDLKVYLNKRYGLAESYKGTKEQMVAKISPRKGIIAFGHSHVDLWEGDRFHLEGQSIDPRIWENESVKLRGIFFWEIVSKP